MKALALVTALSLTFMLAANAQDSKPSLKSNGVTKQGAEAAATIDVSAIQKKIDEYTEAIKNDPKNDKYYGARGQNYWRIGKFDQAVDDLNHAITLNPNAAAYFEVRGDAFGKMHRNREAFADYSKAISAGRRSHYLFVQKGYSAVLLQDYRSAEEAARTALDLKPTDIDTLALIGGVEKKLGKYHEALKFLNKAILLSPLDPSLLNLRAETYYEMGQKELGDKDLKLSKTLEARRR